MTRDEALEQVQQIVSKRREELQFTVYEILGLLKSANLPKDEIRYRLDKALSSIRSETWPGLNIVKEYVPGVEEYVSSLDALEDIDDGI